LKEEFEADAAKEPGKKDPAKSLVDLGKVIECIRAVQSPRVFEDGFIFACCDKVIVFPTVFCNDGQQLVWKTLQLGRAPWGLEPIELCLSQVKKDRKVRTRKTLPSLEAILELTRSKQVLVAMELMLQSKTLR